MELKKLDCHRIAAPKRPTYEAVGDYQMSKLLMERLPKCTVEDDVITGNVAVSLSIAKRDLHLTESRLKAKRHDEQEQRRLLDEQWAELERKEQELKNNFVQFNEFITENANKRHRALEQQEEHRNNERMRKKKIDKMIEEYRTMREFKKLLNEKLGDYMIYEQFLQETVDAHPESFADILDVLKRYEALVYAKKYLSIKQQQDIETIQEQRKKLKELVDAYQEKLQAMYTHLSVITQRHDITKAKCLKWERILEAVNESASEKLLEIEEVKATCLSLYEHICKRMRQTPIYRGNMEKQLFCIRKALRDLAEITRRAAEVRERAAGASERAVKSGSSR